MNTSSKNITRTLAVGAIALSISSLGSWAFAAATPAPAACTNAYMRAATVTGQNLSTALERCYVNAPAGKSAQTCAQNAFQAHYKALLAAVNTFQNCGAGSA